MSNELKHIKTIIRTQLHKTNESAGCGQCQVSCQSACKTSCTVGNQICENN